MFLQTGGGGKGIRPNQQQQSQQQSHHHQQQQQQQAHQQQQQSHLQQQQQQQQASATSAGGVVSSAPGNHQQSHHSIHPGHHHGSAPHIGHPGGHQQRQHQAAHHLAAFQSYSTPYVHLQAAASNAVAATSLAQPAQLSCPASSTAVASVNAACSTVAGGGGGSLGGAAGSSTSSGGGSSHNYGRGHGGGPATVAGSLTHFGPPFLQLPPPGSGSSFITQPPPGTYLQPYHPHSQQTPVVLAAAAAASAHFNNVNGQAAGSGSNSAPGVNATAAGGTASNATMYAAAGHGQPPHSHQHQRHPHPQTVAAFYGHNTNVPPPPPGQTPNNHHLAGHGQHSIRTVLSSQRHHQAAGSYLMQPLIFLPPGAIPGHPQNSAQAQAMAQLLHQGSGTGTPTHLPPPTYIPQSMAMVQAGLAPQPLMQPPSTLHTYPPSLASLGAGGGSGGHYKEAMTKKRTHAIPIIDPLTNENILGGDGGPRRPASEASASAPPDEANEEAEKAKAATRLSVAAVAAASTGGGVAVSVTVSPSLFGETRDTDKTITPTTAADAGALLKTDQQMQTDAVARSKAEAHDSKAEAGLNMASASNETLVNEPGEEPEGGQHPEEPESHAEELATGDGEAYSEDEGDEEEDSGEYGVAYSPVDLSLGEDGAEASPLAAPVFVPQKTLDETARTASDADLQQHLSASSLTRAHKEPLLQIPKYAVKQEMRSSKSTQKTLPPHYGGNNLNYQAQKIHLAPHYPQAFMYHPHQMQQIHTQPPPHHLQYSMGGMPQMAKVYHQAGAPNYTAMPPNSNNNTIPSTNANTNNSSMQPVGGGGGAKAMTAASKKNRKNSRNTKERDSQRKTKSPMDGGPMSPDIPGHPVAYDNYNNTASGGGVYEMAVTETIDLTIGTPTEEQLAPEATGDSPKKGSNRNRKDSDKTAKAQRSKDLQGGKKTKQAKEDVRTNDVGADATAKGKGVRAEDIVERFLQPMIVSALSDDSPKSNGEDSQLQFLNSSSSACEEEEELLQQEMRARHASEVSTEGILFGDFGEENDVAASATPLTAHPPPAAAKSETVTQQPELRSGSLSSAPTSTPTPHTTPASSPAKSRKSSLESNPSNRRGGGRGRGQAAAKEKERAQEKERQEKAKAKQKEATTAAAAAPSEPSKKSSGSGTAIAKPAAKEAAAGGPHRYTLETLKNLSKAKESLKAPLVMNCHKGDCISHLFVPRPHNAGQQASFVAPAHTQQYQQMNFNESIDFLTKRRGGNLGAGGGMSKRQLSGGQSGTSLSAQAQAQRNMDYIRVHLSLKEEIKLSECENAWQPDALRNRLPGVEAAAAATAAGQNDDIAAVLKKVRGVLNKLTPDNFDVLLKSMTSITMNTEEKMKQIMLLIFEKTVSEPNFAPTYAKFCKVLFQEVKSENKSLFSTLLIKRIQQEFETNVNNANAKRLKLQPLMDKLEACTDAKERLELKTELEDQEFQFRRRAWGTVRFIGEMYKLQSITSERVLSCVELLLEHGSEEKLEYMCKLLTTVGHQLEQTVADHASLHSRMDKIFKAIQQIVVRSQDGGGGGGASKKSAKHQPPAIKISSRVRFMMQDVIDLRSRFWDQPSRGVSAQRGRHASVKSEDSKSRPTSSGGTAAGGGSASGSALRSSGNYGNSAANPMMRRQSSDLRDPSNSRSTSISTTSYFLNKKKDHLQQQSQPTGQIDQQKLNIDLNKLQFNRDEGQTKLGNQSMYMWRMAGGKQSGATAADSQPADRNPWAILGKANSASTLPHGQHNNANNNEDQGGKTSSGGGKYEERGAGTNSVSSKKGESLEEKLAACEHPDSEVWYTMTTSETQKVVNRLIEEYQDGQRCLYTSSEGQDSWQAKALQIWRELTMHQQISLMYNILMDYLHLAAVKPQQRNDLAMVFSHLLRCGDPTQALGRKKFSVAYRRVGEEFADLLVDVPNGWVYAFEFLGPLLHEHALEFGDIWLAHWLDDCEFTERFLIAFVTYFTREFGANYVRELWQRERLDRGQRFMKKETAASKRWDNFIQANHFQFIYEGPTGGSTTPTSIRLLHQKHQHRPRNAREQVERIDYLMRTGGGDDCELALDYVATNVSVSEEFVRSLTQFLCCDFATVVVGAAAEATLNNNAQTDSCSNKTRSSISSDGDEDDDEDDDEDVAVKSRPTASSTTISGSASSSTTVAAGDSSTIVHQLDSAAFRQGSLLLRQCLVANERYEMACLSGVVEGLQQRYEPSMAGDLIGSAFDMLHQSQVISKQTFNKWYEAYRSGSDSLDNNNDDEEEPEEDRENNVGLSSAVEVVWHQLSSFMEKFLTS